MCCQCVLLAPGAGGLHWYCSPVQTRLTHAWVTVWRKKKSNFKTRKGVDFIFFWVVWLQFGNPFLRHIVLIWASMSIDLISIWFLASIKLFPSGPEGHRQNKGWPEKKFGWWARVFKRPRSPRGHHPSGVSRPARQHPPYTATLHSPPSLHPSPTGGVYWPPPSLPSLPLGLLLRQYTLTPLHHMR